MKISKSKGYLIVAIFWLAVLTFCSLKTQAQNNLCDSLSYTVLQGLPLTVYMEANGIINMVDSIEWNASACNTLTCYTPQGKQSIFIPINKHD